MNILEAGVSRNFRPMTQANMEQSTERESSMNESDIQQAGSALEASSTPLPSPKCDDNLHDELHPQRPVPEFIDEQFAVQSNDDLAQSDCSVDNDSEEISSSPRQRQSEMQGRIHSAIRRLEVEIAQQDFAIEKHQTAIQKHQLKKAGLRERIDVWLSSEPKRTPTQPALRAMETISESATLLSEISKQSSARDSKPPSDSGKTTLVEHGDELNLAERREITSYGLDAHTPVIAIEPERQPDIPQASQSPRPSLSKRPGKHLDIMSPPKRKRSSLLPGRRSYGTLVLHKAPIDPDTEAEHPALDQDPIPIYLTPTKSRLSQMFRGKGHSGTPTKQVTPEDTEEGLVVINSSRPVSYPLARRFRKSLGVSVKTITERFERMSVSTRPV